MNDILSFDQVKMRRARFWGLVILFPLLLIALDLGYMLVNLPELRAAMAKEGTHIIWASMWFITHYCNFVAIHLMIALLSSILANMEHQANAWKLIFAMPVSRVKFYWVKVYWPILGVLASSALLMVGYLIVGALFGALDTLNLAKLFSFTIYPYLTGFALMGFQIVAVDGDKKSILPHHHGWDWRDPGDVSRSVAGRDQISPSMDFSLSSDL